MPWWDLGSLSRLKIFGGTSQDVSSKTQETSHIDFPLIEHQNEEHSLKVKCDVGKSTYSKSQSTSLLKSTLLMGTYFPSTCSLLMWSLMWRRKGGSLYHGSLFPQIYPKPNIIQEVQLGSHTVRSHGVTVARTHMHDWLILMLLVIIEIILFVIHPFYRYVGEHMMTDLRYPLKSNTVPVWAVPMYAVLLPILIFLVVYFRRRDVYDLHHAVLGLLFSVLITAVITDAIKNAVGRPRPDFFWRCFPDGKDLYDQLGDVICHGDKNVIKEGHKSFPSGHTSWSFAGLGFLSLYLSGKVKVFDRRGHVAKLCIVFFPLLFASLVGISRVDDYWHHWQDVFAGGLIGLTVSTFCYLQFFPPPYHHEGWGPYAYFRVLEESRASTQAPNTSNVHNGQALEVQVEEQHEERRSPGCLGLSIRNENSYLTLEELESGRT